MRLAIDRYHEGYDIYAFEEPELWEFGRYELMMKEIRRGINHGQPDIALVGYSHGGGTVYILSQLMANEGLSSFLIFTSYIDGVRRTTWEFNPLYEDRRSIGTWFHQSLYQTTIPYWFHGHPASADDAHDYIDMGLKHDNIDDSLIVLDRLRDNYFGWINP